MICPEIHKTCGLPMPNPRYYDWLVTRPLISLHPVWEFVEQILPNNSQVIIVIISL